MRAIRAGLAYFALVFGAGFVLGLIRVPFLVPRLGVRYAELLEMPLMFCAVLFSARYVVRRFQLPASASARLCTGLLALALLLLAEILFSALVLGRSPAEYIASRDPVSGAVYAVMLGLFAIMPWLAGDRSHDGR